MPGNWRRQGGKVNAEPDHQYLGTETEEPAGGLGGSALQGHRPHPAYGGRRRLGRRAALAVRGADRDRERTRSIRISMPAPSVSPSRCPISPIWAPTTSGPDGYLEHIRKAKKAVDIPVIGSLNGVSTGGWIRYAKLIEEAGADALELNLYFMPTDPETRRRPRSSRCTPTSSATCRPRCRIPVAVKVGPYFSSMANMASKLDAAGADALVLFNRFYQPDIDLETPRSHSEPGSEQLLRAAAPAALGGAAPRPHQRPTWPSPAASTRRGRDQVDDGRRQGARC